MSDRPLQKPLPLHTQHSRETDIHVRAVFELTISACERPQIHALDGATTGIGLSLSTILQFSQYLSN
jgi:hypothetical protein